MVIDTTHTETRDRMLVAAAWLIGLGSLFLIKDLYGWGWPEAWPLFVIYVGIGASISALLTRRQSAMGIWAIWWPLAVIVVGVVLLLSTTGAIGVAPNDLLVWWPVAVIVLGLWFLVGAVLVRQDSRAETLNVPLAGVSEAEVRLRFGGGELIVGQAESGTLLSGRFEGGVVKKSRGPGRIELEPFTGSWPLWWDRPLHWQVGLTGEVPVDLRLDSGANRSTIDLSALRIRRLELHTGASETRIRLPAAGQTSVRVEAGLASVTLEVPEGVAARIRSKMGLGSTTVDERRFARSLDAWVSPDYETAANRVDIDLEGGLGSIRIS
jgi:hypothetical protein